MRVKKPVVMSRMSFNISATFLPVSVYHVAACSGHPQTSGTLDTQNTPSIDGVFCEIKT